MNSMSLKNSTNVRWFGFDSSKDSMYYESCNFYGEFSVGVGTTIGAFCDIGGKVGKNCKIQTHVSIPPLTVIRDNVFLGPGVRIANDKKMDGNLIGYTIGEGSKIGMGALIVANVGKNSIIGAGSLVLDEVGDNEVWYGNPARKVN